MAKQKDKGKCCPSPVASPVVNIFGVWGDGSSSPSVDSFILMEAGTYILMEDGSKIILE